MKTNLTFCFLILFYAAFSQQSPASFAESIEKEKQNDYAGAIKALEGSSDSLSYDVNLRLGWLSGQAGFIKQERRYYLRAAGIRPDAIEPRLGLATSGSTSEDITDLTGRNKKLLERDPDNKSTNTNLALIYYYNRQYEQALPYFQKVSELYPFDYDANLMLGSTYLKLGRNEEAGDCFKIVLMSSPQDVSAKEGLLAIGRPFDLKDKMISAFAVSAALADQLEYQEAINVLQKVYDPASYFLNMRLGFLSHLIKAEQQAVSYYKTAANLKPAAIEPWLACELPLEAMRNNRELQNVYGAVFSIDPYNMYAHYKLGVLLYDAKNYSAAYDQFEQVLKLYPADYNSLLMLGWTDQQLNNNTEAKVVFSKVLSLVPDDASAKKGLALKSGKGHNGKPHTHSEYRVLVKR